MSNKDETKNGASIQIECSEEIEYPEIAKKVKELVEGDENAYSQNTNELQT